MIRNGTVLATASLLALTLTACDPVAPPAARDTVDLEALPTLGPGVLESVRDGGPARIIIALTPPPEVRAGAGGSLDRTRMARAIAADVDGLLDRVADARLDDVRRYRNVSALAVRVLDAASLERLAGDPAVRRIDLDVGGRGALGQSVAQVGADARHARGNQGAGVTVAILDTGVDTDHPALASRIVHQACFGGPDSGAGFCPNGGARQEGDGAAEDDAGHGTHVTGIVASNGAIGAPGMAPAASIVAIKVLDNCSFAGCFQAFSELVAALDHLIQTHEEHPVRAINMSLGTNALFTASCDEQTAYNMAGAQAVNTLRSMGVLSFAASMNNGSAAQMASPACLSGVIAVAAVDRQDQVASFSNTNRVTDLAAPGVAINSLAIGSGTLAASGTSMATPHAVGCAALLAEALPGTTADLLAARLVDSPVTVVDPKNGISMPRLDCQPGVEPPDPRSTVTVPRPQD